MGQMLMTSPTSVSLRWSWLQTRDMVMLFVSCFEPQQIQINVTLPAGLRSWGRPRKRTPVRCHPEHALTSAAIVVAAASSEDV